MAKYRRRLDILADIISIAREGAKKTKIMYFANLSYVLLTKYLDETLHLGFLRFNDGEYEATSKGEAFLKRYAKFSSRYSRVRKDLQELGSEAEVLDRMCRRAGRRGRNCRRSKFEAL